MSFGRTLKQTFNLAVEMAIANFKLRNEGSYLGVFWYLLNPILQFIVLLIVFSRNLGQGIEMYPVYVFIGVILFNYFQQTTVESARVMEDNKNIIKSIRLPLFALPLSVALKNLFSHLFEYILLIGIVIYYSANITGLIVYPFIFILFFFFTLGVSFIISAINVHVSDMENVWAFAVKLLWLGTPIFYAISSGMIYYLNQVNPIYYFISAVREIIINGVYSSNLIYLGIATSVLFFLIGFLIFGLLKNKFAEKL